MEVVGLKHLGMLLVFAAGLVAAVYGVSMLVLVRDFDVALAQAVGGLVLVVWVILHPARTARSRS